MVPQELVYPDSVVDQSGSWGANVKILNSTHFAWGRETEDGESVLAGGGRYEYHPERDVCVEHIQYHSDPSMNGGTLRFEARVEGGGLVPHRREGTTSCARCGGGSIQDRPRPSFETTRRKERERPYR